MLALPLRSVASPALPNSAPPQVSSKSSVQLSPQLMSLSCQKFILTREPTFFREAHLQGQEHPTLPTFAIAPTTPQQSSEYLPTQKNSKCVTFCILNNPELLFGSVEHLYIQWCKSVRFLRIMITTAQQKKIVSRRKAHNKMREFGPHIQVVGCSGQFFLCKTDFPITVTRQCSCI